MVTQDISAERKLAVFDRAERSGSIAMVLLVAFVLVGVAVALFLIGRSNAQPYILALLSILAVVGVFSLFAGAAGILRLPGRELTSSVAGAAIDSAPDGIVITDAAGRVLYANQVYLSLVEAVDLDEVRPVERAFIGEPDVSEAVYRLAKAA